MYDLLKTYKDTHKIYLFNQLKILYICSFIKLTLSIQSNRPNGLSDCVR